jgi:uncharacterized delta-60 repeat protein
MRTTKTYRLISFPILALFALLFFGPTSITAAPGDLDPTFGVSGKVIGSGYGSYDVAIQPDGKIVTVGGAAGGSEGPQITIARYNINGSPDTTFGGTGRVFIDHYQIAIDVAIQPDGKIVVASRNPDGDVGGEVIRLNSDGSLDTSFGTNGIVDGFLPSVAATLPEGKLLIAGASSLFRLNANGSVDTTFRDCRPGASAHYPYNRSESVIQPDGRILTEFLSGEFSGFGVFRCNADGTLDTSFGSGGVVITPISGGNDVAESIAIQMDGKIVVAGQSQSNTNSDWQLTVVRYHPNGALDTGFGTGGIATTPTGIRYWIPPLNKVVIQTNGKIVVATTIENGSRDLALVRYNPNGSLDTTFNGTGKVITSITNGNDYAQSLALQPDGKFVIAGAGENGSDFYDLVVRYQGDSSTPTSCPNPIDCNDFFVRQQYQDFLNREPDAPGLAHWAGEISACDDASGRQPGESLAQCTDRKRTNTSAAFFLSPEFQYTGYFVYRLYKGSMIQNGAGRFPTYQEFLRDVRQVASGIIQNNQLSASTIEQNKKKFAEDFVQRAEFRSLYDPLSNFDYVERLFQTTGNSVSAAEKQALVQGLNNQTETRASVLQKVVDGVVVIAEGNQQFTTSYGRAFYEKEFNSAFVLMEYFGYLQRDPDAAGYQHWLNKLNLYGNYIDAEMVKSFITSPEYRARFGQP